MLDFLFARPLQDVFNSSDFKAAKSVRVYFSDFLFCKGYGILWFLGIVEISKKVYNIVPWYWKPRSREIELLQHTRSDSLKICSETHDARELIWLST